MSGLTLSLLGAVGAALGGGDAAVDRGVELTLGLRQECAERAAADGLAMSLSYVRGSFGHLAYADRGPRAELVERRLVNERDVRTTC
jgi:hypothetical protein